MKDHRDRDHAYTATKAGIARDSRAGHGQMEPPPAEGQQARRYALAIALVALATLLGLPLRSIVEPTNLVMLYLLAVVLAALKLGRRPAIVASVLSVVAFDLVFVKPFYTPVVADAQFLLTFAGLLGVSLVISSLAANAREQARFAQRREAHTTVLYELSRDLAAAASLPEVLRVLVTHIEQVMGGQAMVLVDNGQKLELSHSSAGLALDEDVYAVASWAFTHGEAAGRGTANLAGADGFYLPLTGARDVVGVLGVVAADVTAMDGTVWAEQRRLLESFASQAAVAIERSLLAEKAQEAQLLRETEKLQTALLNSISHDLRTPLAAITGALSSLHDDSEALHPEARMELVRNAYEEAERLNRLVANLLDMSRLEAGALFVRTTAVDVEDVLGVALAQLAQGLQGREIVAEYQAELPLVGADFVLLVRVFVNLLDNAAKYAPPGTPITIRSFVQEDELMVQVLDQGPGIPEGESERIFEKFYRTGADRSGRASQGPEIVRQGTGLGLSISKGIVEAQHGRIWATNRPGGGAIFTVALPMMSEVETAVQRNNAHER